jgi:parvulin-like peptidyl-prolyl isomerase
LLISLLWAPPAEALMRHDPVGEDAVTVDSIAATVNDEALAESEVRKAMAVSALRPESGESREAFRTRVLEALIDQHLQYQDALRFDPAVPDAAEVDAAMKKLRERLQKEGKDPAAEFQAAGLTPEEVRSSVERQLLVQRYLRERFRPIAFADEERAREEYESRYVPERRAAGLPVDPFETVAEEMRTRSQQRVFDEEVEKWIQELRQKARIAIYRTPQPAPVGRTPILILTASPRPTPTPLPLP